MDLLDVVFLALVGSALVLLGSFAALLVSPPVFDEEDRP